MKVLYLTPGVFDKGGISRYNRYQINALRDVFGVKQVGVVSSLGPSQSDGDLETAFEVDWHGSSDSTSRNSKLDFLLATLRFGVRGRPDVIWAAHLNYAALAHLMARAFGSKSVVQVYGLEVWTPRARRPDIPWGLRKCDHAVSDCHFTADYVETNFRLGDEVTVIWDCVDLERFYPRQPSQAVLDYYSLPNPATRFNIMTLGRLTQGAEYKGYERLLEVFRRMPENARLVFGGSGDLVPRLKARARALRVHKRVTFTGFVHEAHLPDVYRAASVFCLIGDRGLGRGEGIPLTPLEAAACGIPILVGNQDGSREAVVDGVNGFAIDPFDIEEIAHRLDQLAKDSGLRQNMGEAARARIEQEHSYAVFLERMRDFIQSV